MSDSMADDSSRAFFNSLPPGIRFCPHDSDLILHYLRPKLFRLPLPHHKIFDVNIYLHNPDDLAEMFSKFGDKEWYFFTSRDRKYPNGTRPNRAARDGYWKATGADRKICHNGSLVGFRKTLVFYQGKAQHGTKTNWIMHEFRAHHPPARQRNGPSDMTLDATILSRIYKKTEGIRARPRHDENVDGADTQMNTDDTQQEQGRQQGLSTTNSCPVYTDSTPGITCNQMLVDMSSYSDGMHQTMNSVNTGHPCYSYGAGDIRYPPAAQLTNPITSFYDPTLKTAWNPDQ